jgi:hypothetical protein
MLDIQCHGCQVQKHLEFSGNWMWVYSSSKKVTRNLYVILYLKILQICTSESVIPAKSSIERNISYLTEI